MTGLFDFHAHILPGIDDGSRDVEESLAMLRELARQGASGVAATPHFYARWSTPEQFFERRQAAWERLKPRLGSDAPPVRLGAEVQYFEGINRCDGLERFCLEGTELLLLEMPECEWTTRTVSAVLEVNSRENMTVLLAHTERYLPYRNGEALERFLERGVLMQSNTAFFIERRRTAVKMLKEGKIHLLGTDSHNMGSRSPDLARALEIIRRKRGEQLLRELKIREAAVLGEAEARMDSSQ